MMIDCLALFGRNRLPLGLTAAALGTALIAGAVLPAAAVEMSPAAKAVVDYDKSSAKPDKKYRIAYLTECVDNPYCLARLAGLKAAAAKYGFEFKIFDANFSPATQAKVVENAVTEGFDGYLFGPAAAFTIACSSRPANRSSRSTSPCAAIPTTHPAWRPL